MNEYSIHGGDEGAKRLDILSRTLHKTTADFLNLLEFKPAMECLDLGCGNGGVTFEIANLVGNQCHVTGYDLDEKNIELALKRAQEKRVQNVTFKTFDCYELEEHGKYDLIYTRFLLSHLSDPEFVLQKIFDALKPNGKILIEDTEFLAHFSDPESEAFDRYVSLYQQLLEKKGGNANLGSELMPLLKKSGFKQVEVQMVQPAHRVEEGKIMAEITFQGISERLIDEGLISREDFKNTLANLIAFRKSLDTILSMPAIWQASARK